MRATPRAGRPTSQDRTTPDRTPTGHDGRARLRRVATAGSRGLTALATAAVAALAVTGSGAPVADAPGAGATAPTALAPVAATTGRTYYVSPTGSDANAGTSTTAPLRSLAAASALALRPGDRLLLQRGGTWTGTLRVDDAGTSSAPVTVSSYGTGDLPLVSGCIDLAASSQVLTQVHVDGCARAGVRIGGNATTVHGVEATGSMIGIEVAAGTTGARVLRNVVRDNDLMATNTPGPDDDHGAFGILLLGDGAEVAWNHVSGQLGQSADYGTDGSAFEVYGAVGSRIHHNVAVDNRAFLELGNSRTRDTLVTYNVSRTTVPLAEFVITRGADPNHGGVFGTVVRHNTARHVGSGSQAFWCAPGCAPDVLSLSSNVFDIRGRIGWADGPLGGGDNVYWGAGVEHTMLPGDVVRDPLFVDAAAGDLRLQLASPAVDSDPSSVSSLPLSRADRVDVTGRSLPRDGNGDKVARLDLGAYER